MSAYNYSYNSYYSYNDYSYSYVEPTEEPVNENLYIMGNCTAVDASDYFGGACSFYYSPYAYNLCNGAYCTKNLGCVSSCCMDNVCQ